MQRRHKTNSLFSCRLFRESYAAAYGALVEIISRHGDLARQGIISDLGGMQVLCSVRERGSYLDLLTRAALQDGAQDEYTTTMVFTPWSESTAERHSR